MCFKKREAVVDCLFVSSFGADVDEKAGNVGHEHAACRVVEGESLRDAGVEELPSAIEGALVEEFCGGRQ